MVRALKIILLIVCAAACLSGFKKEETIEIVYAQTVYVENYGDCFDSIIGKYYDKCTNKRRLTWEDYRMAMKKINPHLLNKDGYLMALHINDPVNVEWYVERKLEK